MKNQPRKAQIALVNSAQAVVLLLSQWEALDQLERMQKELNEGRPTQSRPVCVTTVFQVESAIEEEDLPVTIVAGLCLYSYERGEHMTELAFAVCTPLESVPAVKKKILRMMKKMRETMHLPAPIADAPEQRQN
jgi:hypothetical protein